MFSAQNYDDRFQRLSKLLMLKYGKIKHSAILCLYKYTMNIFSYLEGEDKKAYATCVLDFFQLPMHQARDKRK